MPFISVGKLTVVGLTGDVKYSNALGDYFGWETDADKYNLLDCLLQPSPFPAGPAGYF